MLFFVLCGTVDLGMKNKNTAMVLEFEALDIHFLNFWKYILDVYGKPSVVYLVTPNVRRQLKCGPKSVLDPELSARIFSQILGVGEVVVIHDVKNDVRLNQGLSSVNMEKVLEKHRIILFDDSDYMKRFECSDRVDVPFASVHRNDFLPYCSWKPSNKKRS